MIRLVIFLTIIFKGNRQKILLWGLFPTIVLIAALQFFALEFSWYRLFWWFSVMMHFLGGLWIALASVWVVFYSGLVKNINCTTGKLFVIAIGAAIVVGVGWEIFELLSGAFITEKAFPDTTYDLFADLAGALTVFLSVRTNKFNGE